MLQGNRRVAAWHRLPLATIVKQEHFNRVRQRVHVWIVRLVNLPRVARTRVSIVVLESLVFMHLHPMRC